MAEHIKIFDSHIHVRTGRPDPVRLLERLSECGIAGAVLISLPPGEGGYDDRIVNLLEWTKGCKNLLPFLWVDPREENALSQVEEAEDSGIMGFKIICDGFYPGDERCIALCERIAARNKPVVFHSGILWDGKPSSEFCRPVHFEHMLRVEGLRFSLAHIGWPWVDEMIAVYGKFLNYRSRYPMSRTEMFIDMTPGTPFNYRKEALSKLFGTGYDVDRNLLFGSDCDANSYNVQWTRRWLQTDDSIYDELGIDLKTRENIFAGNLESFIRGGEKRPLKEQKPAVF